MRPPVADIGEHDALIVRTDHTDGHEPGWQALRAALGADVHLVDDPGWADAAPAEVVAAARATADGGPNVLFLADRTALTGPGHPLLAVTTLLPEDCAEPGWYAQEIEHGAEFRALAAAVGEINANLSIGNLGFEEFAAAARRDPEGCYRPGAG
ncbi:DUF6924 domain-containing protein [Kitasatospora sp. NPDC004272]